MLNYVFLLSFDFYLELKRSVCAKAMRKVERKVMYAFVE